MVAFEPLWPSRTSKKSLNPSRQTLWLVHLGVDASKAHRVARALDFGQVSFLQEKTTQILSNYCIVDNLVLAYLVHDLPEQFVIKQY